LPQIYFWGFFMPAIFAEYPLCYLLINTSIH